LERCAERWVSLIVKQLKNRATGLHISLGQATVARGVPAVMPLLLSEEPGSLVREEAAKSRMRNLIRICGQRSGSAFVVRSAFLLLLAPLSFSLCATLPAPHPRRRDASKVHQSPPRSSAETTTNATSLAILRASRKANSTALSRWRTKTAG
jgi:hypothetical protein